MALILSLETSAVACSVALHKKGALIKQLEIKEGQAHASKLATLVDTIFSEAGFSKNDLQAVAVSGGPGSYTGLRIGVSTAKGLCFGLSIPLIAIPTLEALAFAASKTAANDIRYLCPMIDAKRMEVYYQVFDRQMNVLHETEALEQADNNTFIELLDDGRVLFFGDGASKYKQSISHANAAFLDGYYPRAEYLGELAFRRFTGKEYDDLIHYTPFYLKDFVAKKAKSFF